MALVADSFGVLLMIKLSVGLDDVKDDAEKISEAIKSLTLIQYLIQPLVRKG